MEKNHIGTDASMSVHIENIVKRGYVEVDDENGRRLIPTNLGRALIEALENVEPDIILPKNRAKIEECVSELAQGKKEEKIEEKKSKDEEIEENYDFDEYKSEKGSEKNENSDMKEDKKEKERITSKN